MAQSDDHVHRRLMPSTFQPVRGLSSPHLQTLWPSLFRRPPALPRVRERFELADGDFVEIDWHSPASPDSPKQASIGSHERPLAVLIHGLTGCSQSHYILGLQAQLAEKGWDSAAFNLRGASGIPNRQARFYHGGDHADLGAFLVRERQRHPRRFLAAVGFSLGGSILLNGLIHDPRAFALEAAAAVSVPYDLSASSSRLDQGFSRVYRNHLLGNLRRLFRLKQQAFILEGRTVDARFLASFGDLSRHRRFRDFDHHVMAPLHGFHSGADYYERCSTGPRLDRVHSPLLLVQAEDDPFMAPGTLPTVRDTTAPIERLIVTRGGHLGFVGRCPDSHRPFYWMEQQVAEWLDRRRLGRP